MMLKQKVRLLAMICPVVSWPTPPFPIAPPSLHCCSICLAILGALAVIAYRFIATKK